MRGNQKAKRKRKPNSESNGAPKAKKSGRRPYHIILTIVYFIAMAVFSAMLIWLNFLPMEYLISVLSIILVGSILIAIFMNVKKPKSRRRTAGTIIAIVLIIAYGIGMFYIYSTQDMFSKISNIGKTTEDYYVIVKSDDKRNSNTDINGSDVCVFESDEKSYLEAQERLKEVSNVNFVSESNYLTAAEKFNKGKYDTLFMSASYFDMASEDIDDFEKNTKKIYTINIEKSVEDISKKVEKITSEPFNVFISGVDVFGSIDVVSRSDVNMIMTVNPKTKVILLTSIPRDAYLTLHSKQSLDKLTHAGLYGVSESVGTLEDLFGTDINYYIRVNFSTVIDVVDAIGGIEVYSDVAFTTHGRQNTGYSFVEGWNELEGKEALAFARERYSFADGDFQRNRNQQKVLKAMLDKCLSSETILTKYTQLLDAVEDEMQTNMPTESIQSLVKMQVKDMSDWTIATKSISGVSTSAPCYAAGGAMASVINLDAVSVTKATTRINDVMDGKPAGDDIWTWEYDKKVEKKKKKSETDEEEGEE